MQTVPIITVLGGISVKAGGRTRAVINRMNLLGAFFPCTLLVASMTKNVADEVTAFRAAGRLEEHVTVLSLSELLGTKGNALKLMPFGHKSDGSVSSEFEQVTIDKTNRATHVASRPSIAGFAVKRASTEAHSFERFESSDGLSLLFKRVNADRTGLCTQGDIVEIAMRGGASAKWYGIDAFISSVLLALVVPSGPAILMSDVIDVDSVIALSSGRGIKKIGLLHGRSFQRLEGPGAQFDRWVCLTASQKKDLELAHPNANTTIIPHAVSFSRGTGSRRKDVVISMGHLNAHKRVEHIIEAVALAKKRRPAIQLEIYGEGDRRADLEVIASLLGISDSVHFKGFTSDAEGAFRSASAFCFASQSEGFAYVIAESIICGCPVVSYDIKYGPSDLIQDGVTGRLAKNGSVESLANKLIECLEEPVDEAAVVEASESLRKKLSPIVYQKRMSSLIQELIADVS